MNAKGIGLKTSTAKIILYRHQSIRRTLKEELKKVENERRRRESAHAHKIVLFLAGTAQRREARSRRLTRLFTMFKVKPVENEVGVDALRPPKQQQQQQQELTAHANSSTESEISVGSYQSSGLSQTAERAALWISNTPMRQRALSVDVPTDVPPDTPRRRSAPEVVVTHVPLVGDAEGRESCPVKGTHTPETQGDSPTTPTSPPTPKNDISSSPGRLSPPTLMSVPGSSISPPRTPRRLSGSSISPPRTPRRLSSSNRPASHISRISKSSQMLRKSVSPAQVQNKRGSLTLTEISAPLEDARSVFLTHFSFRSCFFMLSSPLVIFQSHFYA
nr:histone H3.v1-like [Cherax quadricarinatus]